MKKVVLNKCYGGFDVSDKAYELYAEKMGLKVYPYTFDVKDNNYYVRNECSECRKCYFTSYLTKDYGDRVHRDIEKKPTTKLLIVGNYQLISEVI